MRKSLVTIAVLGTLALPTAAFAADAAPAAAPAPAYTVSYNVGLYSQYIFRGLTQTAEKPSIQGGVDFAHSSGFYLGAWGSNISWLEDGGTYDNSSLELDVYGGYANTIGDIGYNIGALQYIYPGKQLDGYKAAETTEVYGALSYKWLQGKMSYIVSKNGFGNANASGSYYAELNANIPLADSGVTANLHVGRQEFDGSPSYANSNDDLYSYTDWKVGATKAFSNGVNVGAYYSDTDGSAAGYGAYSGGNIAKSTFTAFVQKTF